ncbi:N-alpha-acetyl diaminobutyric acid deacetylase DoeB [Mesorhizobium loti]|uniref:Putative succinylglutamate desuccinylase n=1 Tax=Rhizobium loti TaxID=381 RepID=M5AM29_RHILI|nr:MULTISPECIES: N(2)-acetyl-L-2,4-diaminobutanoate deacetylase DoeB [Mesorhizobium]ANN60767.1 N-alpha-acetyl diaminobutyric acid deacetylase DoeB [Mesorhizobium loti NZP2037]OBP79533.1 N-alpha-acetyl diaminobutyric acid deacetylase DoeB [Mesorhizobium loti]OBP93790.1 N-alpha-acetyl diaminobutyric acid deacetylase DoeB [Mesorhizobium loti]OBQ73193.1 N-alpha-acetyl diaminobutyric acid deacetylase DoeB [Mesorhizobium loti]QKC66355.1 N-alpha-acetyl diaminobutyric acid deacetylase DoeB [Mesorhizob
MLDRPLRQSPIAPTVDFSSKGTQHGFMRLPFSRDDSAWGAVMIPVTVVRNGEGPTALLTGGNHGDEYEGPIALFDLARSLKAEDVTGTVIIVPAMNYPAFLSGTRTSPIDRGNMNRSFPGAPDGTVTQKIADYFQRYLLPLADIVLDFHSGGKTLDFLPYCAAHRLPDKVQERKSFELVQAFGAPYSMAMLEIDAVGMYDTAAEEMGKVFVTTELGGGGTTTAKSVRIAKTGVTNVLKAAGILKGEVQTLPTIWLDMPDGDCFSFAEDGGLFEPLHDLGDRVAKGNAVARIYPLGRTGAEPLVVSAKMDGVIAARHFPGLVTAGDCISVLAVLS